MKTVLRPSPDYSIKPRRAGWSLIELMVAMLCGMIILASLTIITGFAAKSYLAIANYRDLDNNSREALDVMSRDIRNMDVVTNYAGNTISLDALDGSAVTYTWDSTASTLTRIYTSGGTTSTTMLLTNCTSLAFHVYSQVPIGPFQFPDASTNIIQTKLIDVSWRCARAIFGTETNSESVQTAKIVIRNHS
jgi:hypothetical protein